MYKITYINSKKFSSFSKDKNLIHLNKKFASKFYFRQPIAHGINVALIALNDYLNFNKELVIINEISINFRNTILLNEPFKIKKGRNKILIFNDLNVKIEIFIRKKIINDSCICQKRIKEIKYQNKYLVNEKIIKHLVTVSKIIGSIKPGNGALIHKIDTKYNKNIYNLNRKIKFKKLVKNFFLVDYVENYFQSKIITSKLIPYNKKSQRIKISKEVKQIIFNKKILIIGSSGDIGYQLSKSFNKSKCFLFKYSFIVNETDPIFSRKEKGRLKKFILRIKPNYIFYLSSPKIYHGNKSNKILIMLYNVVYCEFLRYLLEIISKFKISVKIFYPSSFFLYKKYQNKFKYLNAYIYAKKKAEVICNDDKYKNFVKYFRLPKLKTRSNYNLLGNYEGQNLSILSTFLTKFFTKN
jgi:hypothetical protein